MAVPGVFEIIIVAGIAFVMLVIPIAIVVVVVMSLRSKESRSNSVVDNPMLTKCPDCGKAISIRAASCPHCGTPAAGAR